MRRKTYRRKNKGKSRRRGGAAANEPNPVNENGINESGLTPVEIDMLKSILETRSLEPLLSAENQSVFMTKNFVLELMRIMPPGYSSQIVDLIASTELLDYEFVVRAVKYCPQILECTNYDVIAAPGFIEAIYKSNPNSMPFLTLHDAVGGPNDLHDQLLNYEGENGVRALEEIIKYTTTYNDRYVRRERFNDNSVYNSYGH
jgi:hypothetical protein